MSGISQASGVRAARNALYEAIKTALADDHEVDVTSGFRYPEVHPDWVSLTKVSTEIDVANIGGRGQRDETIRLGVSIGVYRPGYTEAVDQEIFDRAFGLLETIQTYITTQDITLGGTVLWCLPGTFESDAVTTYEDSIRGRLIEIAAEFVAHHRVRPN